MCGLSQHTFVIKTNRPAFVLLTQVVYEELKTLMGGQQAELVQPKYGPSVILMAGLQVRLCRGMCGSSISQCVFIVQAGACRCS